MTTPTTNTTTDEARANSIATANEILRQLGGRRFSIMTGARDYLATESGLRFKLPARFARQGINLVTITLDPSDTYSMTFERITRRGYDVTRATVARHDGLYFDQLQDVFTNVTGLRTRL